MNGSKTLLTTQNKPFVGLFLFRHLVVDIACCVVVFAHAHYVNRAI